MEYCCLESKNEPDETINRDQQNYFSYLNLKKSGLTSDLDVQPQDEVVTVRRTRRVLYRYILEKSSIENEEKGDNSTLEKSKVNRRTLQKGKKKNVTKSKKKNFDKNKRQCIENLSSGLSPDLYERDESSNRSREGKYYLDLFQVSEDSRDKKQPLKRPSTDTVPNPDEKFKFTDCKRIPYKKRKIIHSFLNQTSVETAAQFSSSPEKNLVEKGFLNEEFKVGTDFFSCIPKTEEKTDDIFNFMRVSEKPINNLSSQNDDVKIIGETIKSKKTHLLYLPKVNAALEFLMNEKEVCIGDSTNKDSHLNNEEQIIDFIPKPSNEVEICDSPLEQRIEVESTRKCEQTVSDSPILPELDIKLETEGGGSPPLEKPNKNISIETSNGKNDFLKSDDDEITQRLTKQLEEIFFTEHKEESPVSEPDFEVNDISEIICASEEAMKSQLNPITNDTEKIAIHFQEVENEEKQEKSTTTQVPVKVNICPEIVVAEDLTKNDADQVSNNDTKPIARNCLKIRKEFQNISFAEQEESSETIPIEESKKNECVKTKQNMEKITKQFHDIFFMEQPVTEVSSSIHEVESPRSPSPRIIRIEKSPERQIPARRESQKNCTFENLGIAQNLSGIVQKETESFNDCYLESELKIEDWKTEEEVELDGEPDQMEVIHYKPIAIPNHFVVANSTRKYCNYCNVGYMNEISLEKHMLRCKSNPRNFKTEPRSIFYCKICNFGITDAVFFKQHEEKCRDEFLFKTGSFSEDGSLRFKKNRPRIGRYECPTCEYTSDNIGHMGVHKRIHDKIPLCVCDVCQKGFSRLDVLRRHMFKHIDVAEELNEAKKVKIWNGKASKTILKVKIKNKGFTIFKYECSECKYATPVAESMDKHFNSMHLNEVSFQCNLCPFTCKLKTNLKQHLNWHSRERTYKCSYCPYETINQSYIKKHENQVHLKANSFDCDFCDFKSYRKENLKAHVNNIHLKAKKFVCDRCDYVCYVQSNLIGHVKSVHEGIKRKKKQG